ncbi:MAG: hypothetical protein IPG01_11565 [Chitinophagaceae bacterium]|nr:hypothetical protein [Chitinophagaceae bacterium]
MNQSNKDQVIVLLQPFWDLDIDKRIAEAYKDSPDLETVVVGHYTVSEISGYSKKMISQLGQILDTAFANILPYEYQFNNDFGNGNLKDDITTLNTSIGANDFATASTVLSRLVYYQVVNGFWNKVMEKDDKKRFARIVEMESKINLITEQLSKNIETNKSILQGLNFEKDNIEQFVAIKRKELTEIESLLPAARNNSEEITRLHNTSIATNESINSLLTQQNTKLEEITKKYEEERSTYSTFQQELKDLKDSFNTEIKAGVKKNTDFDAMLISVADRSDTFDNRIEVLNELIGKEGAQKLFNTFNDRKNSLEGPIKRWANIVFATGIIALALIIGIFTNFYGWIGELPTEIDWHYLLINSIKALPIMIVLLFTIKQYVRERTFQEEYAFRSAIALTVQAYGDIAGTKKEELIMKAISTIYSLPSIMKDRSNSFFGYRSKILNETMKELNQTLKTFKPE